MHLPGKTKDGFERFQIRFPLKGSKNCHDNVLYQIARAKKKDWQKRHKTCTIVQGWNGEKVWKDEMFGYVYFAYRVKQIA